MIVFYQPPSDDDELGKGPKTGRKREDDELLNELAADHVTHAARRLGRQHPPQRPSQQIPSQRKPLIRNAENPSGGRAGANDSDHDSAAREEEILDAIVVDSDRLAAEVVEQSREGGYVQPGPSQQRGQRIGGYLLDGTASARRPSDARAELLARKYGQWEYAQAVSGQLPRAEVVGESGRGLLSQIISKFVGLMKRGSRHIC